MWREEIRGTIPFFGPSFSMRIHLGHISSHDIMAKTLELFSPGTLVGMECVLMATDAGKISEGVPVICCAGTERGLDTAWLVRSAASANISIRNAGSGLSSSWQNRLSP